MWRKSRRYSTEPLPLLALAATPAVLATGRAASGAAPELARRILSDGAYQRDWPGSPLELSWGFSPGLGMLGELAFLIFLATCLIFLIDWLMGELSSRYGSKEMLSLKGGEVGSVRRSSSFDLERVDRLAAEGCYDEAVHALLLMAIGQIIALLPGATGPSRTSRELLGSLPPGARRREAFGELVREVELSLFGGRPVGLDQYARCRRSFDLLIAGTAS
jgi:hypothetical protein